MLRIIIMTISLIAVIAVNGATNIMPFNGSTTGEISKRLPVLFTPASYVHFIWPVIYILLAFWIFGFWKNRTKNNATLQKRRAILFTTSTVLNIALIVLWLTEHFIWAMLVTAALLMTLLVFYFTYPRSENQLFERIPIAVYLGWMFISIINNISYVLTLHEWNGWGLSSPLWTVIYLTIAAATALHFIYHYGDIALNFVFIWAFVGIAVKNGFEEMFVSAAALFLSAVITVCIFFLKKEHRTHT
ncbi:tryptophan-rich sensory protein [Sporosarcina sp. G11-34]|uniref:tryptophan-rich sensory protein n=1 Tax=Sporosarcina sp. G11-34 TaxID=2849605 RepID=UPI0022A9B844|nr:tryptophan-rich sensory protein [Sporosarcina sp. G11-34]MCZ2260227.1 tryptophan-rich sensory protein [Sporosarcina sp. G11-34]